MKHTFFVLLVVCGALTAASFAGSHGQGTCKAQAVATTRASAPAVATGHVVAVRGQAPVAVVTTPDGCSTVAPCVAVAACDPSAKCSAGRKRASTVRSVVRSGGGGSSTVQSVTVDGRGGVVAAAGGKGSRMVSVQSGGGSCSTGGTVVTAPSGAGVRSTLSAQGGAVGHGRAVGGGGALAPSSATGSCATGGTGTMVAPSRSVVMQTTNGQSPSLVAAGPVDLGGLVQGLRTSGGLLASQDPIHGHDHDDEHGDDEDVEEEADTDEDDPFAMHDVVEMDFDGADAFELAMSDFDADAMRMDLADVLAEAQAQLEESDAQTRETLAKARAEIEAASAQGPAPFSGFMRFKNDADAKAQAEAERAHAQDAYSGAMRAYNDAAAKAHAESKSAHEAARDAVTRAHARTQAAHESSREAQDRAQVEWRSSVARAQDQTRRALEHARAVDPDRLNRGQWEQKLQGLGYLNRNQDGQGLEARVRALEEAARARGFKTRSEGSLVERVEMLERYMNGQSKDAKAKAEKSKAETSKAPKARVLEVPGGVGGGSSTPGVRVVKPKVQRSAPDAPSTNKLRMREVPPMPAMPGMRAMPKMTPPTAPTPPTPATPSKSRSARASRIAPGAVNMDEATRRDLERAMVDLRREADRLREEMQRLRDEIERLPRNGAR